MKTSNVHMFVSVTHTLLLLGLMQRTKNGLEALRVDIRECNEFWVDRNKSSVTNCLKRFIQNALSQFHRQGLS